MKIHYSIFIICIIIQRSLYTMDTWDIIRQEALANAHHESNTTKFFYCNLSQDSYFTNNPCEIIGASPYDKPDNQLSNSYFFDPEFEEVTIQNINEDKESFNSLIHILNHQARIGLFIVERSKQKKLNASCQFKPFKKNEVLNWCTILVYMVEILHTTPMTTPKIAFGLETVARFFSGDNKNLHIPDIQTLQDIKKILISNLINAKKMLYHLAGQKKEKLDYTRYTNVSNYSTVLGTKCLRKDHYCCPINQQLFIFINKMGHTRMEEINSFVYRNYGLYTNIELKKLI